MFFKESKAALGAEAETPLSVKKRKATASSIEKNRWEFVSNALKKWCDTITKTRGIGSDPQKVEDSTKVVAYYFAHAFKSGFNCIPSAFVVSEADIQHVKRILTPMLSEAV